MIDAYPTHRNDTGFEPLRATVLRTGFRARPGTAGGRDPRQKDFTAQTQKDLVSTFTQITDQLNIFLAGIAGISFLVGGIGIMNIMLVSVAERTREIGVRKAPGATDPDVLLQFLFESVLLALLGGVVGVGLCIGAAQLMPVLLTDLPQAAFGTTQIALAFGVSAVIGVLSGNLPAYRSARLAPVKHSGESSKPQPYPTKRRVSPRG